MARITGMFSRGPKLVKEIVGVVVTSAKRVGGTKKSVDETTPDYAFWDAFRHGKKAGFELSSLLAKPATEIMASWVSTPDEVKITLTPDPAPTGNPTPSPSPLRKEGDITSPPNPLSNALERGNDADVEYTNELLRRFMKRIRGTFERLVVDLYGLGNQYVVVNPDGSISVPSPDMVEREYDAVDYRRLVKVTILSTLEKAIVTDEYRMDGRTITIKNTSRETLDTAFGAIAGGATISLEFNNLIGRLPVVHFANDRGVNETNGRPIYAALYKWFGWYNDLLVKALKGAKLLSNPILVLFKLASVEQTQTDNSLNIGETYQDENGALRNRDRITIDEEEPMLLLGEGADAKYVSPGTGFTNDVRNMLKALYLLFMEHLHLPDVVMGFEMAAARASAAEQIKTFFAHIRGRRTQIEGEGTDDLLAVEARGGLLAVIDIWLRMKNLTDSRVVVGPVAMTWPELDTADETLKFNWVKYLDSKGYIRPETTVAQSGTVEDAEAEVKAAKNEEPDQTADETARWEQEELAA